MDNRFSTAITVALALGPLAMSAPFWIVDDLPAWSRHLLQGIGLFLLAVGVASYFFPDIFQRELFPAAGNREMSHRLGKRKRRLLGLLPPKGNEPFQQKQEEVEGPVGIRADGVKGLHMEGNIISGFKTPMHITNSSEVTAKDNLMIGPAPEKPETQ